MKIGDKVRVVNFGHLIWQTKEGYQEQSRDLKIFAAEMKQLEYKLFFNQDPPPLDLSNIQGDLEPENIYKEDEKVYWVDIDPQLIGQEGIIDGISKSQGRQVYSIKGLPKHAWYELEQLELC